MKLNIIAALAAVAASAALADVQWTYDESTKQLAEILPDGSADTASVYYLSADGRLSKSVHGTTTRLDFRRAALPENAPDIKVIADIRENYVCEEVFLPETLTKMEGCTFYHWTSLKRIEFPDEVPSPFAINGQSFDGAAVTNVVLPKGVTALYHAFVNCASLTYVRLPDTLETFGNGQSGVFQNCTKLEVVEPLLPVGVTNIPERAFQSCYMTNAVEIGFAVDSANEPIPLPPLGFATFWNTKVHSIRFGPGVNSFGADVFWDKAPNLGYVEFGENVTNLCRSLAQASGSLTNVVFRRTADIALPDATDGQGNTLFKNCKKLREITWSGWFTYSTGTNPFIGWSDLQCRFLVPGANLKWSAFVNDATKVLPWSECSETDRQNYYDRYGSDAREPAGITVAVTGGLPRTYVVTDGETPSGAVLNVEAPDEEFGTLTVSPAANADGTYESGTTVTLTFAPADGVTFDGWTGDVAEEDRQSLSVSVVASGVKTVSPSFTSSFFVYKDGVVTDGETAMNASGDADAISVTSLKSLRSDGVLDLWTKPVKGGRITAFANNVFDMRNQEAKQILLPKTLTSIGYRAIVNSGRQLIWPLVPDGVTYIGSNAFLWEMSATGSISVGFATDADGNPVETVLDADGGQFARCNKMGPEIRIGPGVRSLPRWAFSGVGASLGEAMTIVIGKNVESAKNAVFGTKDDRFVGGGKPVSVTFEGDMFDGSSGMFYAFDSNGACDSAPADYVMRFYVGASGSPLWRAFLADASLVTPWASLDEETQQKYWNSFPVETFGKKKPFGLTTEAAAQTNDLTKTRGLPARQWVFSLAQPGFILTVR